MELVEIKLTDFTRRSRSLSIAHSATELTRGLEYGERVLVRCLPHSGSNRTEAEYRTAVVAEIDFELEDTCYRLVLGGRLPLDIVEELQAQEPAVPRHPARHAAAAAEAPLTVAEVARLLAHPSGRHLVPQQRSSEGRLLGR